ncbi:hypothetical protein [Gordonia sp. VNK21]|uniref:hypothetical protein n=1 Tax=Gordonia sp. VNK21 TaxID=3382483 RepID=UPI0038D4D94B
MARPTRTTVAAATLIVAALIVRTIVAARGDFYWDDLILIGRSTDHPVLSWGYLGHSHDGHFMPGAFLIAGLSTLAAPLQWWLPALTLVLLQLLASLAVWRMITVVAPRAPRIGLAALACYLFVPMTLPAFTWWSAGLNSLPLQAGMAVVVAAAVLLMRPDVPAARRRRLVAGALAAFVLALLFFEKSLLIAPVAVAAALLAVHLDRQRPDAGSAPLLSVCWRRGRALWLPLLLIFLAWAVLYLAFSGVTAGDHTLSQTAALVWRSVHEGIVPALAGGPWFWDRWIPSPPMGMPPAALIAVGWVLAIGAVALAVRRRRGAGAVWVCAVVYAIGAQLPVMWNRSSAGTALELAQTLRYLPDTALVLALAIAFTGAAPARTAAAPARPRIRQGVGVLVMLTLIASSLASTATFSRSWRDDPTGAYLSTAAGELSAHPGLVMFDQPVPLEVLSPMAYPYNQISRVFGRLPQRPRFGRHTDELWVLDSNGRLVPGAVSPVREIPAGPGSCGRPPDGPAELTLSGQVIEWTWTVGLSYCADRSGEIAVRLGRDQLQVPVQAGLHSLYVQLSGRGQTLELTPLTPGLALHTGAGRVGEPIVGAFAP